MKVSRFAFDLYGEAVVSRVNVRIDDDLSAKLEYLKRRTRLSTADIKPFENLLAD